MKTRHKSDKKYICTIQIKWKIHRCDVCSEVIWCNSNQHTMQHYCRGLYIHRFKSFLLQKLFYDRHDLKISHKQKWCFRATRCMCVRARNQFLKTLQQTPSPQSWLNLFSLLSNFKDVVYTFSNLCRSANWNPIYISNMSDVRAWATSAHKFFGD